MMGTAKHTGPLVLGEHAFRRYCVDIPAGVTFDDLFKPEYWRLNTDGQLRPRDRVRVTAKDGSFDCELIVSSILPGAGVIMAVDDAGVPGSPTRKRLEAIEASVRVEEEAKHRAEIEAAIGGRP